MKLALLVLVAALVLGGVVGVLMARDPGYVLLAYQDVAVETSLWFALALLAAVFAGLYLLIRLLVRLGRSPGSLQGWQQRRRAVAARAQTDRGLLLLAEGRFQEARKLLAGAAHRVDEPLVNYLYAARAAQELGDVQGRDDLLRAAHESQPQERFVVGLTQAELQHAAGQWEQCLATLLQLRPQASHNARVLVLLADCYRQLGDWQAVTDLAGDLERHGALGPQDLQALQQEARQRLEQADSGGAAEPRA